MSQQKISWNILISFDLSLLEKHQLKTKNYLMIIYNMLKNLNQYQFEFQLTFR